MANKISPLARPLCSELDGRPSLLGTSSSSGLLPPSLAMPLAPKKRPWSLTADLSATRKFSLPFKKRRFNLICLEDDEYEEEDGHRKDDSFTDENGTTTASTSASEDSCETPRGPSPTDASFHSPQASAATPLDATSGAKDDGEEKASVPRRQPTGSSVSALLSIVSPLPTASPASSILAAILKGEHQNRMAAPPIACITPIPRSKKSVVVTCPPCLTEDTESSPAPTPARDTSNGSPTDPLPTSTKEKNTPVASGRMETRKRTVSIDPAPSSRSKRVCHPKLESPLPNGCHGQTSRTHSFCRRGPLYNGSNYCKLHYFDPRYQALIQAKNNDETKDDTHKNEKEGSSEPLSGSTVVKLPQESVSKHPGKELATKSANGDKMVPSIETEAVETLPQRSRLKSGSRPHSKNRRPPRDRLYRGNVEGESNANSILEVRCLAISTRGKRCCYCAVASNNNQYCHRHSSFFVGIGRDNAGNTKESKEPTKTPLEPTKVLETEANKSKAKHKQAPSGASMKDQPETANKGSLPSPRPPTALSDLSTDLWQNRKVTVAKGPHKSRTGTVVRWRNGWVTVKLPPEGGKDKNQREVHHNRRSYELFLA